MKTLTANEIKTLEKILTLSIELEKNYSGKIFSEQQLVEIKALMETLCFSETFELQKISEIQDHLHPQMTMRHFHNFLIPIERLLGRSLRDDHFLITRQDQKKPQDRVKRDLIFVLENIRSVFNVGSLFRLADCVGAKEVRLCGYTATPEQETLTKTSLGTHEFVHYQSFSSTKEAILDLQKSGFFVIALETAEGALDLFRSPLIGPTAFVVGNERFGLEENILELCDEVRKVPMYGIKNSLNVANSLSIAAFEWSRQNP